MRMMRKGERSSGIVPARAILCSCEFTLTNHATFSWICICSAASPTTTEAVTEFCVIHIEDEPGQVTSEPVENPVRTMAKPVSSEPIGEVMPSKTIVLPGSPDLDHTSSMFADSDPNSDPQSSRCGSSISSEVSVKSTDALIISGKN